MVIWQPFNIHKDFSEKDLFIEDCHLEASFGWLFLQLRDGLPVKKLGVAGVKQMRLDEQIKIQVSDVGSHDAWNGWWSSHMWVVCRFIISLRLAFFMPWFFASGPLCKLGEQTAQPRGSPSAWSACVTWGCTRYSIWGETMKHDMIWNGKTKTEELRWYPQEVRQHFWTCGSLQHDLPEPSFRPFLNLVIEKFQVLCAAVDCFPRNHD